MRLFLVLLFCLLLGCQNPEVTEYTDSHSNASPKVIQNIYKEIIPQEVKDYIKMNLPEYIIPETSDYSKTWWSFYEKNQIPYVVTTDLNDDNLSDYAFILKNSNTIKLVILIATGNTFIPWIADDFKEPYSENAKDIQFGLAVEPPGRTDCVVENKEQSLMIQSNGIALLSLEQKYQIYYWKSGKINRFRVTTRPLR